MHLVKFRTIQVGSIKNKWKFWCIIRYLHALKIPPQKNTSYRGIKDNFTVEKTNQVIRVMEEMKSWATWWYELTRTAWTSAKLKLSDSLWNNWFVIFKVVDVVKVKDRGPVPDWRDLKLDLMQCMILIWTFWYKRPYRGNKNTWMGSEDSFNVIVISM